MELHEYISVLHKRWLSIALISALSLAAAVAATLIATPTYQAKSQVFVSVRTTGTSASDLLQGSSFTRNQVKSYTDLVTTPRVLIPVIEDLGLASSADDLARSVTADSPLDTVLINITATHEDPRVASDIANATANSLSTEVTALEKPDSGPSPVQISTVRVATVPETPSSPNKPLNLALGLLVGLGLGLGQALLREAVDTRVRTSADVGRVTSTSVIATIPFDGDAKSHPLIGQVNTQGPRAESFRRLRTNLQFLDLTDQPQTIVVTSSLQGEGKSTTAMNLAITLADAGSRVCLVDADLRRPAIAGYAGMEGEVGLTTVLIGRAKVEDVLQPWGTGHLHVLPSGQVPPNPSELLGSRAMATLLAQLAEHYDVVLIDTPPLLPVVDAAILSRLAGGALVVVGAKEVHRQQLSESLAALESVGARVLGIVVNRQRRRPSDTYGYGDYASTPANLGTPESKRRNARGRRPRGDARRPRAAAGRPAGRPALPGPAGVRPASIEPVNHPSRPESTTGRWPGGPLQRGQARAD